MSGDNGDVPEVCDLLAHAVSAVGGTHRDGQRHMAESVHEAIRSGEHLAAQAGTGTGKSLAYLVPAIRHAVLSEQTIVISTATIALQRQLIDRDLPQLADALETSLGRAPTFAILKGRRNYLCLHRLHTGPAEEPDEVGLFDPSAVSRVGREVARLHEWSSDTETGDRDELVPGVSEQAWRQVSVGAEECLGVARCPVGNDCFAEQARAEAGRTDLVITNHALLAIDALQEHQVLPEHDVTIVDEAHALVDRVTSVATSELTAAMVSTAARRCGRVIDAAIADQLLECGEGLSLVLEEQQSGRLDELPQALAGAVAAVRDAAHRCVLAVGTERKEDIHQATAHKLARALLDEVHDTAVRLLEAFDEEPGERRDVVWCSGTHSPGSSRPPALHIAPLTVGGLLRERVFGASTTILTSATLALGGTFDTLARQWGLPPLSARTSQNADGATTSTPAIDDDEPRWNGIDVGSPFDYRRNGILYVAKHLPSPGRSGIGEEAVDELTELVRAAGGRALGLFSSLRAAQHATEVLRERLDLPILCQGEDSTALLIDKFAADEQTCLFGTLSLWQGVNVPGSALQLVVIDRLPFPRPDDPVASARQRVIEARGGNGFLTVAASHAALLLAQGAGRLHRSISDRGVVAVLDSRLATAGYAGFLRASLPPLWPTHDSQVVCAALQRLDAAAPAAINTNQGLR